MKIKKQSNKNKEEFANNAFLFCRLWNQRFPCANPSYAYINILVN